MEYGKENISDVKPIKNEGWVFHNTHPFFYQNEKHKILVIIADYVFHNR
jgi:hypothetical protein